MENNMKELNLNEMEEVSGGFKTELLSANELALYNSYLRQAENGTARSRKELLAFKNEMRNKYGSKIFEAKDYIGILRS